MFTGKNYNPNLGTKEIAKEIRQSIKNDKELAECKWSVKTEYYSGGSSIHIALTEAPFEAFTDKFKREHEREYTQHAFEEGCITPQAIKLMNKVREITRSYLYDNSDNNDLGTFSANDIALQATLGYELARNLSGGITLRGVYGSIGPYNSLAVTADLGLNLYIPESEWSVGIVAKNLGGQIKAYDEDFEKMPLDLQVGVSKRLIGSPLRLSLTLVDLNHTGYSLKDHMVIGAEALLSDQIYVAGGYNFRRAHDMKVYDGEGNNSSHGAGLSFGAGVNLERVKINIAYSKLHVSASTLIANIAFTL